jgi:hypothetical protein
MPVTPQEFSLWARMTGNKYPNSVEEKVRLAPEVHNFSQNVGKQGALGVQEEPEPEQKSNLGSKLAKGALIAGGIAAGVAAARNPGVQEAVKTASGKASDFISKITTPREVNVDTAEAVRDVTNSAPGDVYSQASIPDPWQVEAKGGEIVSVGDRAKSLITEIASKYGTNGADEEYVHPSRIPGMPGGDYRGRRTTYSPEQQEAFRLTKQEADERAIIQNEGVIPPGMLTREQQAYLKLNELGGETLQAGRQRSAERDLEGQQRAKASPLVIGTPKGGYDSRHVYAQDSDDLIDPYGVSDDSNIDHYFNDKRSEVNRARDYEQDQQMQADAYWNSPEGQAEIVETQADAAFMDSDSGKANYQREAELDSRGLSYDHRPQIETWKDGWKTGNQSLSNKADAVISALGASDPDFGHTQYAPSEAVEAADADLSQNPVNTALSGPTTPGNNVPTIKGTYDPGTLTGQQQIQMSADNAVDQVETSSAMEQVRAKKAELAQTLGTRGTRADRFFEKYFPSMQQAAATEIEADLAAHTAINPEDASTVARAYYDPDKGGVLREGSSDNNEGMTIVKRNPFRERSLPNYGPEAQVTKPATTSSIRGGGRRLDVEESISRERDLGGDEMGPDLRGGIIGPSTVDLSRRATGQNLAYKGTRPSGQEFYTESKNQPIAIPNPDTDKGGFIVVEKAPISEQLSGESLYQTGGGTKDFGGRAPRGSVRSAVSSGIQRVDKAGQRYSNPGGMGVYGQETGFVPGAMSSKTGEYTNEAIGARYSKQEGMHDPGATYTDAQGKVRYLRNQPGAEQPRRPSEPLFIERTQRDPFKGVPSEVLQGHLERAKPGTPTHQNLSSELYRRSGQEIGIIREPGETRGPTALEFLNAKTTRVRKPSYNSIDVWRRE